MKSIFTLCCVFLTLAAAVFAQTGKGGGARPRQTASAPLPLVLAFHGAGGTGEGFAAYSGLSAAADGHGFAVLYPNAARRHFWTLNRASGTEDIERVRKEFGFDGKSLIHPSQVGPANAAFTPDADAVAWARTVVAAFGQPEAAGKGVLKVEGRMVERLHFAEAELLPALREEEPMVIAAM